MNLSIVVSTHQASFEAVSFKGSVGDSMAAVAAAGYDGVELAVRNAGEVRAEEISSLAGRYGLSVPAIGTGQMWGEERLSLTSEDAAVREAILGRLDEHIALAANLDALVIIGLVRGVFPREEMRETATGWLVEGLGAVGESATRAGVRVALEGINRYETAYANGVADGLELLDRVGNDSIGLLLDTFHMNIEEPDMAESIRIAGDRVFHVHAADSNRWYPGAGHIDFREILETLASIGYDGWISGEFLPKPDGPTSIRKGIEHMRPIVTATTG